MLKSAETKYNLMIEKIKKDLSDAIELSKRNEENGHLIADNALCEFLDFLGYNEIVDLFDKVGKWYS